MIVTILKRIGWTIVACAAVGGALGWLYWVEELTEYSPELYPLMLMGGWLVCLMLLFISIAGYVQAGQR